MFFWQIDFALEHQTTAKWTFGGNICGRNRNTGLATIVASCSLTSTIHMDADGTNELCDSDNGNDESIDGQKPKRIPLTAHTHKYIYFF